MKIQLIPVIEFGYYNQDIPKPEPKPNLRDSEELRNYRIECFKKAGCPGILTPFFNGTDFYRLGEIPLDITEWLIHRHIKEYLLGAYEFDQLCPFSGGYALLKDNQCLLYPQCCGDLSDIIYWKYICKHKTQKYYNGHPVPKILFENDKVSFTCIDENDPFYLDTESSFEICQKSLLDAYLTVLPELDKFYQKCLLILSKIKLPESPDRIANRLVYENIELSEDMV